jgi:glyoxylase-like metal-dependent hydrolase (beta-lactamase superfamily II)
VKLHAHSPTLYRIAHYGLINCYIVVEDEGLTLVDTGIKGTAKLIEEAVTQLDQPVRRILITHAHGDHVGGLDMLHERYPNADVLIGARDARLLKDDSSPEANEPQTKIRGGIVSVKTQPTRLLHEGDRIGSLEAFASSGHTPGHMAFLDTRNGSLIAGDAFATQGGLAVAGQMRLLFPLPHLATWHPPTALESARKLVALKPTRLAVGHGPVLENPTEKMQRVIAQFSQKLERR